MTSLGTEEIQQALHRGGFAGPVAAKESVTSTGLHRQGQVIDGLRAPVGVGEVLNLDGRGRRGHFRSSLLLMVFTGSSFDVQYIHSFMQQFEEFITSYLQMVRLNDHLVDLRNQQLAPDFLAQS